VNRVPPKLLAPDLRRSRAIEAGVLALGLIGALLANPDRPLPVEVCAFKYLTGLPCPTCGLTRAVCHALRGDWISSLTYHPAGILVAAILIGWMLVSAAEAARGRSLVDPRGRWHTALFTFAGALSIFSWIVRLA
jgi:hypothetical protein